MKNETLHIRTTKEEKERIQIESDKLNLSISNYVLKCVNDKKEFISVFEYFKKEFTEVKEKIDTSFYYLKEDTEILKENDDDKSFITININKEEIEKKDLIIIKGNVLEVLEHKNDEQIVIVKNLMNDKRLQLNYTNLTEDMVIKRRI